MSGTTAVEIVQTVARKRRTAAQILLMVEESWQPGDSVSRVARCSSPMYGLEFWKCVNGEFF